VHTKRTAIGTSRKYTRNVHVNRKMFSFVYNSSVNVRIGDATDFWSIHCLLLHNGEDPSASQLDTKSADSSIAAAAAASAHVYSPSVSSVKLK
jgi:hypothetical protein